MFKYTHIEAIKRIIVSKGETISVAESVTAGILQSALSASNNASDFFQGGITVYNLGQKVRHLKVNPIHAQNCNCVSKEIAKEMALGVCELFVSDYGIGITGYATPVEESEFKIFCFFAVAHRGKIILSKKIDAKEGDAQEVQMFFAKVVLDELWSLLK